MDKEFIQGLLDHVQACPEESHAHIDPIIKDQMKTITVNSKRAEMTPILDLAVHDALASDTGMLLLITISEFLDE